MITYNWMISCLVTVFYRNDATIICRLWPSIAYLHTWAWVRLRLFRGSWAPALLELKAFAPLGSALKGSQFWCMATTYYSEYLKMRILDALTQWNGGFSEKPINILLILKIWLTLKISTKSHIILYDFWFIRFRPVLETCYRFYNILGSLKSLKHI